MKSKSDYQKGFQDGAKQIAEIKETIRNNNFQLSLIRSYTHDFRTSEHDTDSMVVMRLLQRYHQERADNLEHIIESMAKQEREPNKHCF